jgi:hypothetical protein
MQWLCDATVRSFERVIPAFDRIDDAVGVPVHDRRRMLFQRRRDLEIRTAALIDADYLLAEAVGLLIFMRKSLLMVASLTIPLSNRSWLAGFARIELLRISKPRPESSFVRESTDASSA